MNLAQVSSDSTDLRFQLSVDRVPTANLFGYGVVRKVGSAEYASRVTLQPGGGVALHLLRNNSPVSGGNVAGLSLAAGEKLNVATQAEGTSPTVLRAKVWKDGTPEPEGWSYTFTDSTAALQAEGGIGLGAYLGGTATNAPIAASFSGLWAGPVGATPGTGGEAPNAAPVAEFSLAADRLRVDLDGSGSTDADGSITEYAWDFGDGQVGSGAVVSHEYATAGSYDVTLTVTDDRGATGAATRSVTVTTPAEPGVVLARDVFARSVSNGWGSADVGGAWTIGSGVGARYSVESGSGTQVLHAAGASTRMNLADVSSDSTDLRFQLGVDRVPSANLLAYGVVRKVGSAEYASRVTLQPGGGVALHLLRNNSPVSGGNLAGLSLAAGEKLNVVTQAEGTSPTVVRAKVWKVGTPEPSGWSYTFTDSTAALQVPGSVGVGAYLSGSATNAPIAVSFADLWAGPVGTSPGVE
ncbi:PKD domain-containing protein [Salana multivorans]